MAIATQNRLRRIGRLLSLLGAELAALAETTLLPAASFTWHSLADLFTLIAQREHLHGLGRRCHGIMMRIERRIESFLPASLHHRHPFKSIALLALLTFILTLGGDADGARSSWVGR